MVININRSSMAGCGYSPPTRIFEAAGAAACMLCDDWPGVEDCFGHGREIIVIRSADDVVQALRRYDRTMRRRIGTAFFTATMQRHTYGMRAQEAEEAFRRCMADRPSYRAAAIQEVSHFARGAA